MQKRKQRTVPEALWRVYHNRARTLADTILSFLPSPPPSSAVCRCKGRRCLGCAGDKALSFLLRAKDPPEYQKLLKKCFVAVDDNAPQFPGFDPCRRWHHLEIIKRSIEMIMSEQSTSSNMLCCGFDKRSRTSDTVELLDSSSWKLLLKRVGDIFLVYLLKNTSIFIPLPQRKYLQIAGFPISSLCQQVSNDLSCSQYRHFSQSILGRDKKIKACKDADRRSANIQGSSSARVDFHSIFSGSIIDLSELINASQSSKLCGEQSHLETLEVNDSSKSHEKFIQTHKMSRKRKRPTSWQRRRKHGQLNSVATNSEITDIETPLNNAEIELVKEEKQESSSARVDLHSNFSGSIIGCSKMSKKRKRPTSWQRRRKRRDLDSVGTTNSCVTNCETPVDNSNMVIVKEDISCLKENTSEFVAKPLRKNSRHYSWQRLGKNVKFNTKIIKESSTLLSCRAQQIIPFEKTQCDCCLKFQRLHKFNATSEIDRKRIFYKLRRSPYIFPRKHILNALPPTYNGARILFRQIFGSFGTHLSAESVPCRHHEHSPVKSTCLYHVLLEQLKSLIRKTQSCQHLRLLERHCAVTSIDQVNEGCEFRKSAGVRESVSKEQTGNIPYGHNIETCGPSNYVCLKKQVISFIWASCRSIIPRNMLGSPNNWRVLIKNISKFVCLRRFEKFTLRECMHKFKVSKYPLLLNSYSLCSARNKTKCEENIKKYKIIECWILWIFSEIVVPMIQANFYVTESEYMNQEVYYFRRSIWEKLACKGFTGLKDQSHIQLTLQSVRNIISARSFGFSRIRLLPKENGFRMLANLKASSRLPVKLQSRKITSRSSGVKYRYFKSVNNVLSDVHWVLKGIKLSQPEKLGSSVFDYNDIYRKIVPFLSLLKNGSDVMPSVYVVVSDVSKAYDTVDQKKLLNIMDEILSKDEYSIKKHLHVLCTRKSLLVCKHQEPPLPENISGSRAISAPACAPSSIIVKEESRRKIKKETLNFNLDQHIRRNVLQFGNIFFLQTIGIPQGSVLSSLLCCFYLGHLERNVIFPFLDNSYKDARKSYSGLNSLHETSDLRVECEIDCAPKYLMLRFIDDFLFISTSRKQASSLFSMLKRGFPQYNCYMNEGKFGLNFGTDQISGIGSSNRHVIGEDRIFFLRWSGLLVNSSTLEIQADYSRYLQSHLSTSLTVNKHDRPGSHLKGKLCGYLRPKCHPLFYDSNINSAAIVRLNIYQAFLVCAMKFHCHIRELNGISTLGIDFCTDAVLMSIRYMKSLIKRRMHSIRLDSGLRPRFEVAKEEIEWLGLTAYIRVLNRKHSCYGYLISVLRSNVMTLEVGKNITSALEYAVDDSHSFQLWKIRY